MRLILNFNEISNLNTALKLKNAVQKHFKENRLSMSEHHYKDGGLSIALEYENSSSGGYRYNVISDENLDKVILDIPNIAEEFGVRFY